MTNDFEALVTSYDEGWLTRRQLCQALMLLATPSAVAAQTQSADVMTGRNLHHINVQVSNVTRSEAFYRKLFGLGPSRVVQGPDNHGLDLPGGGIVILQRSDTPGRIDHFCIGVEHFDADRMRSGARSAGFEGVQGSATDNFFVRDPDGLRVQVSAIDWPA
jgi:catechol 2,3-dioxygenase-like lactoylglutathione lyase family enzyme